jgi:predicted PurR-regulated permease PerM
VIPGLVGKLANTASTAVFNIATAIPGVGAVLSAGKVINNVSESIANVTSSVNNASQILSGAVDQMKEKLDFLTLQSTGANKRINKSIQQFENPQQGNIDNAANAVKKPTYSFSSSLFSRKGKKGGGLSRHTIKKKPKHKTRKQRK